MFWVSKVFAPLGLVVGIAATTATFASADGNQPPFGKFGQPGKGQPGKDDKKTDKKDDKKVEEKKVEKKAVAPAKADPQVDAWLAILLTKITDPHDTVRDSARGAIVAVGAPALPALQKLADGDDSAKAVAARKMINAIQGRGGDRGGPAAKGGERGPGGPGGERGFGPPGKGGERGPGGFGGWGDWGWFGPGGKGGERGGPPGKGPGRPGGREEEGETEVAPMPRSL